MWKKAWARTLVPGTWSGIVAGCVAAFMGSSSYRRMGIAGLYCDIYTDSLRACLMAQIDG